MNVGVYVFVQTLLLFLDIVALAMMARMLVSFFLMGEESKLSRFLYVVTEPVILPVRAICQRFGWFQGLPMDMPFFITAVLLLVVRLLLEGTLMG